MHTLPPLPYDYKDLEPYIDTDTMLIHHTKHHQTYIDNLNKALENAKNIADMPVEELLRNLDKVPNGIKQAVTNHGGGHANHSFFWRIMTPEKNKPEGKLLDAINKEFGDMDKFKEQFTEKALSVFGSGWTFLILTGDKMLKLKRHSFQNSPIMNGNVPILGIDVWEHAYYLKYQNKRGDYIKNWWEVVNWKEAGKNYESAL